MWNERNRWQADKQILTDASGICWAEYLDVGGITNYLLCAAAANGYHQAIRNWSGFRVLLTVEEDDSVTDEDHALYDPGMRVMTAQDCSPSILASCGTPRRPSPRRRPHGVNLSTIEGGTKLMEIALRCRGKRGTRVLYLHFKRRDGRTAVIHEEGCLSVQVYASHGLNRNRRGYWLWVWDKEMAEAVARDLRATTCYAKCCRPRRRSGDS